MINVRTLEVEYLDIDEFIDGDRLVFELEDGSTVVFSATVDEEENQLALNREQTSPEFIEQIITQLVGANHPLAGRKGSMRKTTYTWWEKLLDSRKRRIGTFVSNLYNLTEEAIRANWQAYLNVSGPDEFFRSWGLSMPEHTRLGSHLLLMIGPDSIGSFSQDFAPIKKVEIFHGKESAFRRDETGTYYNMDAYRQP
jgi:hypothetical protein